jgi:murein DD-endopeptidase MepM/ murein hydrolase activator NlpD
MISRLDIPATDLSSPLRPAADRSEIEARRVAAEFEALLLTQFTAALNPSPDDEEGDVFRSSASDMYRQMFSEQMATAIAKSGGIGLADVIMRQLGDKGDAAKATAPGIERALTAARQVRAETAVASLREAAAGNQSKNSTRPVLLNAAHAIKSMSAAPAAEVSGSVEPVVMQMPVAGRISSGFGARRDPISGHHRHHQGVDIAVPRGTPIEAAASGVVVFAGRQGGYGRTVVIEHADGRRTRYAHAERLMVNRGDVVSAGQMIATVGSTGRATGPHLHFEVTENGDRLDPLQVLANDFTLAGR